MQIRFPGRGFPDALRAQTGGFLARGHGRNREGAAGAREQPAEPGKDG